MQPVTLRISLLNNGITNETAKEADMTDTNEDTTVYWEVTVIIDGAVDACHEWDDTECDDLWLSDWMDAEEWSIQQECPDVDYDIYVLFHDHPPMDCECIQFEGHHHPERSNR